MNFEGVGELVAAIKNKKGKTEKSIYVTDSKGKVQNAYPHIKLPDGFTIQHQPNHNS